MNTFPQEVLSQVREEDLRRWVAEFSGLRYGQLNPEALEETGERLIARLTEFGLSAEREHFRYRGGTFFNVAASETDIVRVPGDSTHTDDDFARSYDLGPSGLAAVRFVRIDGAGTGGLAESSASISTRSPGSMCAPRRPFSRSSTASARSRCSWHWLSA